MTAPTDTSKTGPDANLESSVTLGDLFRLFGRIGCLSFGGPAAQIALMQKELVNERRWLSEDQFLNALAFCMLLPGPEATQLATYSGWRLQGVPGGLIAGSMFVLPGAFVILALAFTYATLGNIPVVEALFLGVQAAVVVIVVQALLKLAQRTLKSPARWVLAGLSFVGIFVLHLPFPLLILMAGLYGAASAGGTRGAPVPPVPLSTPLKPIIIGGLAWGLPILALWASGATLLTQIAAFFSKLAVVTFGGAYAVLAYMTQEVVSDKGWLTTEQMIDALGLAETTPGPLILVTEFVGFLTGYAQGGPGLAVAAAALTLWVTFVPCFIWIFAGAPYIDWIATRPRLSGALSAIAAAVVGVILNLALWFAIHVFFGTVTPTDFGIANLPVPTLTTIDLRAVVLACAASALLLGLKWPLLRVLAISAVGGLILSQIAP